MSTSRPLHLTDTQLASVRRAAALLRPGERSQFLQAIAYELADVDPIDDEAVKGAVEVASVRLSGSDRERGLGRFETAASPDRIPSVVLPLPAPMRRPRDRCRQVDEADWEVTPMWTP